jgi:hypothetical protein
MKHKKYYETVILQLRKSIEDGNKVILELKEAIEKSCEEPKVLTADESWENIDYAFSSMDLNETIYKDGFEKGDKNGQLKQWLNHKELREAVEELLTHPLLHNIANNVRNALNNLKPLNENER